MRHGAVDHSEENQSIEVVMLNTFIKSAVLGVVVSASVLAIGCTSANEKPYAVTGSPSVSALPDGQNPKYLDSKGHFRPELVGVNGR